MGLLDCFDPLGESRLLVLSTETTGVIGEVTANHIFIDTLGTNTAPSVRSPAARFDTSLLRPARLRDNVGAVDAITHDRDADRPFSMQAPPFRSKKVS